MRRQLLAAFVLLCLVPSSSHAMATVTATAITSNTTWGPTGGVADDTILVQPSSGTTLTVSGGATLTIQPGTVVLFAAGRSLVLGSGTAGSLSAVGTAGQPIEFSASNATPGGWAGLDFTDASDLGGATSSLANCLIRRGGSAGFQIRMTNTNGVSLASCSILDYNAEGLILDNAIPAVSACTFHSDTGTYPISGYPPSLGPVVSNSTLLPRADSKFNCVQVYGAVISSSMTLPTPSPGFCYITDGNPLDVRGATNPVLTIGNGTVIKLPPGNYVRTGLSGSPGGLVAHNVLFTSTQDDTICDANGNGPSTGAPNQWRNLRLESGTLASTTVDGCIVRYGGDSDGWMVLVQNSQPTITNCLLDAAQGIALRVEGTSTGQQVSGNLLRNSTTWELSAPPQAMVYLVPNNTLQPSADGRYNGYHLQGATITTSMTLPKPPTGFCYIADGSPIEIRAALGPVLTIADGTVIKMPPTQYLRTGSAGLLGGLMAHNVVFTSTQDDTISDTNGNGPSTGAPNQWRNLRFEAGTIPAQTVVDGCIVRYGGDSDSYAVLVSDAEPTITRCVIRNGLGFGLYLANTATGASITSNLLRDNTSLEISAQLGPMARLVANNTVATSRDGKLNGFDVQGGTTSGAIVLPRPAVTMVYYLSSSITVPVGASLGVPSGCVFKLLPGVRLLVQGTLTISGKVDHDPLAPVVFTSYRDDKWWGDTNGDGPSAGSAGDWQRVEISGGNNSSVVDGAIFSFGGSGGLGQLYANGTGTQAAPNVLVKNCHFYLSGALTGVRALNSNARLDSCSFFGGSAMLGVSNATSTITVLARNSWWGHPTGPFDPSGVDPCTNPSGLGVGVSDFVDYCPFLGTGAPVTDVPPPGAAPLKAGIAWVGPVPARSEVALVIGGVSVEPATLEFLDAVGRIVRRLTVSAPNGVGTLVRWNLADGEGHRVAPGVYFARYRQGGVTQVRRVVITP